MHGLKLRVWKIQTIVRKRKTVEIVRLISEWDLKNCYRENEI